MGLLYSQQLMIVVRSKVLVVSVANAVDRAHDAVLQSVKFL